MPSFDVVSELNMMEVDNAFNQARKELAQRFDFKGTHTDLERDKEGHVIVRAGSEGRAEAALQVLMEKLAKRGVPLEGLDPQKLEPASGRGRSGWSWTRPRRARSTRRSWPTRAPWAPTSSSPARS